MRLFLFLSLIFALLQGAFLPPVFLEGLLVVIFVLSNPPSRGEAGQPARVLVGLFVSGLLFDVVQTSHLGSTSAIFLIIGSMMLFLRQEIPFSKPWVGVIAVILATLARSKFVFGNIDIWAVAVSGLIAFFVLGFARLSRSENLKI